MPTQDKDLVSLLFSVSRIMRTAIQPHLPDTCSFLHVKTLSFIDTHENPTMTDIADELKITSPATTGIIDRLVETGEIERLQDSGDRRIVRLKITTKGRATLKKGLKVIRDAFKEKLSVLDLREHNELISILKKIIGNNKSIK